QSGNPFPLAVKNGRAAAFDRGIKTSSGVVLRQASGITGTENTVGVDGKININTAPAKVLAMIPWMPSQAPAVDFITYNRASNTVTAGGNGIDDNEEDRKSVV